MLQPRQPPQGVLPFAPTSAEGPPRFASTRDTPRMNVKFWVWLTRSLDPLGLPTWQKDRPMPPFRAPVPFGRSFWVQQFPEVPRSQFALSFPVNGLFQACQVEVVETSLCEPLPLYCIVDAQWAAVPFRRSLQARVCLGWSRCCSQSEYKKSILLSPLLADLFCQET